MDELFEAYGGSDLLSDKEGEQDGELHTPTHKGKGKDPMGEHDSDSSNISR